MKTILLVEDEVSIAELVTEILQEAGYEVVVAWNGREALDLLGARHPDLVLSDVMMPLVDGRDLCNMVRSGDGTRGVPVVLMSALQESAVRGSCDYSAFVRKPFEVDTLLATVAQLVGAP